MESKTGFFLNEHEIPAGLMTTRYTGLYGGLNDGEYITVAYTPRLSVIILLSACLRQACISRKLWSAEYFLGVIETFCSLSIQAYGYIRCWCSRFDHHTHMLFLGYFHAISLASGSMESNFCPRKWWSVVHVSPLFC